MTNVSENYDESSSSYKGPNLPAYKQTLQNYVRSWAADCPSSSSHSHSVKAKTISLCCSSNFHCYDKICEQNNVQGERFLWAQSFEGSVHHYWKGGYGKTGCLASKRLGNRDRMLFFLCSLVLDQGSQPRE